MSDPEVGPEPVVGPDAAQVERPGPAFDGGTGAAEYDAAAAALAAKFGAGAAETKPAKRRSKPRPAEPQLELPVTEPAGTETGTGTGAEDAAQLEAQLLAAAPEEQIEDSGLPDLTDDAELDGALESVLLVVDSPIAEDQLSSALEQPVKRIKQALRRLSTRYTESGSGIDLRRAGDGWRFYTRDRFAPFVEKLLLDGQRAKLTRAALETLAVIAYRQPVTRARIAAVRGVNVDGVIRTLVARGLIEETGTDSDTGGILYRTTELFLERLGLSSLNDLPPIAPLLPEVDAIDDV
ncbi:SMC-Scp complex subunit ScpB [Lentzea sp. NPDC042327]|uniref:SMC-Scp complex subunit ScpB n=1 Tax=Lentzea sp. NPDC042327 TaxID=3154801 RepID=UPI0033C5B93F